MNSYERLDEFFLELEKQNLFSGTVLITKGGLKKFHNAYGYASRQWKIKNKPTTRFDTASITKLFTSIAILQLIQQCKLTFETRVIELLKLEGTAISNSVTVFHLLTHTSGIGDDVEEEDGEDYANLWKSKPNYSVTTTSDFLPQFVHKPPNFPPGQGCRYCNCSFILLGLIIEKITGLPYRDYIDRYIFQKAGLHHSGFYSMEIVNENIAEGVDPIYAENGEVKAWKKNIYSFPPIGSPDGGAIVSAEDLDIFLRSVQKNKLLSPELTELFLTPKVIYKESPDWTTMFGFGLKFYLNKKNEIVCYQKEGINAGVSAIMRYFPDWDIHVVLLSNMSGGVWKPVWKIHELVTEGQFDQDY